MNKIKDRTFVEKIASWKKKFYQVSASGIVEKKALAHSILKWSGLTEEELSKHDLTPEGLRVNFRIDSSTCALCNVHMIRDDLVYGCGECPLYLVRGKVACDSEMLEEEVSPYHAFTSNGDAQPMIRWLNRAKKFEEKRDAEKTKKKVGKKQKAQ